MWLGVCHGIKHIATGLFISFPLFLSSFQSSKKTWTSTWVCSNLSSPLEQVRNLSFMLQKFSVFDLLSCSFTRHHVCVRLSGRRLNISAENDCRRLHCSLRDLSSLLQAVGRLAEYFIGEIFAARFNDALAVVERSVLSHSWHSHRSLLISLIEL